MKAYALVLLLVGTSAAQTAQSADWTEPMRPAYRGAEFLADGVYGLLRGHLFSAVVPGGLSRRMSAVPVGTSEMHFAERLRRRQERTAMRLIAEQPVGPMGPAEAHAWRRRATQAHMTVVGDAFADTLVRRYQLERFGHDSGDYARNLSNWDPEFLMSAGVLGGAYLYVAGLRTDFTVGPLRVDFDTRPGSAIQSAVQNGDASGLAALTVARRGSPLSLKTVWGVKDGRMASERVGVDYSARF